MNAGINREVQARIIAAADQLFNAGGRGDFPAVDAVRRVARADMNTTSQVMKEWRRAQTAQPAAVAIPERVRFAQQAALAELWTAAQELANEGLSAARQAWEAERVEAEALRGELSQAFESQAEELAAALARIAELEAAVAQSAQAVAAQLDQARQEAGAAREESARLAGQLQAHQEQSAAILARLAPVDAAPTEKRAHMPRAGKHND
jgi:chromosome segregation ATPase